METSQDKEVSEAARLLGKRGGSKAGKRGQPPWYPKNDNWLRGKLWRRAGHGRRPRQRRRRAMI